MQFCISSKTTSFRCPLWRRATVSTSRRTLSGWQSSVARTPIRVPTSSQSSSSTTRWSWSPCTSTSWHVSTVKPRSSSWVTRWTQRPIVVVRRPSTSSQQVKSWRSTRWTKTWTISRTTRTASGIWPKTASRCSPRPRHSVTRWKTVRPSTMPKPRRQSRSTSKTTMSRSTRTTNRRSNPWFTVRAWLDEQNYLRVGDNKFPLSNSICKPFKEPRFCIVMRMNLWNNKGERKYQLIDTICIS